MKKFLENIVEVRIRFSEVDSMSVVWHGNYIKYFEEGREAFGAQYGLGYLDVYDQGYKLPLVDINCQFKKIVKYGERVTVHTKFIPQEAAKICFEYVIRNEEQKIVATGSSTQIFMNEKNELELVKPDFVTVWEEKWLKE